MKLSVIRSGGMAGMNRTWEADIPDRQADRWLPLLKSGAGVGLSPDASRDTFTYVITLGEQSVSLNEESMTPAWQELIDLARH